MHLRQVVVMLGDRAAVEAVASDGQVPGRDQEVHAWVEAAGVLRLDREEQQTYRPVFRDAFQVAVKRLTDRKQTADPRIGARLKDLVAASGYSVQEVARVMECSRAQLYKIFKDEVNTSVEFVCKLLNAIGCTWADLDYPAGGA